jgi:hypothetical protein
VAQQVGIKTTPHALRLNDFVVVDAQQPCTPATAKNTDTLVTTALIYAGRSGRRAAQRQTCQDFFDSATATSKDLCCSIANHPVIDHGNGEFSMLGHPGRGSNWRMWATLGEQGCSRGLRVCRQQLPITQTTSCALRATAQRRHARPPICKYRLLGRRSRNISRWVQGQRRFLLQTPR